MNTNNKFDPDTMAAIIEDFAFMTGSHGFGFHYFDTRERRQEEIPEPDVKAAELLTKSSDHLGYIFITVPWSESERFDQVQPSLIRAGFELLPQQARTFTYNGERHTTYVYGLKKDR